MHGIDGRARKATGRRVSGNQRSLAEGKSNASSWCDVNHVAKVQRKRQSVVTRIASKLSHFAEGYLFQYYSSSFIIIT